MTPDLLLPKFAAFLAGCWDDLSIFFENDTSESMQIDWLQASWELLVEGLLRWPEGLVLEPYGDGADCNGASSRILYPELLATHRVVCRPREGTVVNDLLNKRRLDMTRGSVVFDRFVCIEENGWYYELPPFDKILGVYRGESVVIGFDNIGFELELVSQ